MAGDLEGSPKSVIKKGTPGHLFRSQRGGCGQRWAERAIIKTEVVWGRGGLLALESPGQQ